MALDRIAVAFSIVAAAAAGYAAVAVQGLSHDLRAQQDQNAALTTRLADAEAALAAAKTAAPKPPPLAAAPEAPAGLASRGAPGAAPVPASVEARLAALEKSEAEFRKMVNSTVDDPAAAAAAADGMKAALAQTADAPVHFEMPRIYGSPEDAAKHLDLSPAQKAEFERAAADAKREMEELKKIPDDTGKTWNDVAKETFTMGDGGVFSFDTSKLREFREKTVPGRSESFGAAEKRIRDSAKSRLRSSLTSDQQSKFDKALVDPMLGTGGGGDIGMVISSVEVSPPISVPLPAPPGK